jgi:hypothetical protein
MFVGTHHIRVMMDMMVIKAVNFDVPQEILLLLARILAVQVLKYPQQNTANYQYEQQRRIRFGE